MMKAYMFYIRYRLYIGLIFLALALVCHIGLGWSFWEAFLLYLIAVLSIVTHFLIGPLSVLKYEMESGSMEGAIKVLNTIKFPNLLIKPVRSGYYMFKGQMDMANQNFESAEENLKKGKHLMDNTSGMFGEQMKEAKGANNLQLGMIALQKNDFKKAEGHIRQALKDGLTDKESKAMALLQMCQIMMNRREFRAAKDFFKRAKAEKPTTKEIVEQIKEMEKYINRMPG
jgi:tetratricopeptide (TPR) repeat protein